MGAALGEIPEGNGCACIILEEVHLIAFPALPDQLVSRIGIVVPCAVVGFTGAKAVFVIFISSYSAGAGGAYKFSISFSRLFASPSFILQPGFACRN